MKREQILQFTVCAVTLLFAAASAPAQQARPAAGTGTAKDKENQVKISRFPPPGKTAMVKTPEYNYSVNGIQSKVARKQREWALFEIKYETAAKWTDELKFDYHVMTKGRGDDGKEIYSYYTVSVRYIDIPKGDHMSSVALPPSLAERYGEPVALALEVTGKDGTVLASEALATGITLPKEWWRDSGVMDKRDKDGSPFLTRRTGLVDRSKTPFALINPDDYEVVQ
ncbi:MAG: hypothetical protein LBW77_04340 [Verrucomicrobiota bacterium]|nr:hypothetical protein [Verrucomicrobiota bacterium]